MVGLAIVLAGVVLVGAVAEAAGVLVERERLAGAADAAALAAAEAAAGRHPGPPCDEAVRIAAANDASLGDCDLDGATATVRVVSIHAVVPMRATATAGRPSANTSGSTAGSEK